MTVSCSCCDYSDYRYQYNHLISMIYSASLPGHCLNNMHSIYFYDQVCDTRYIQWVFHVDNCSCGDLVPHSNHSNRSTAAVCSRHQSEHGAVASFHHQNEYVCPIVWVFRWCPWVVCSVVWEQPSALQFSRTRHLHHRLSGPLAYVCAWHFAHFVAIVDVSYYEVLLMAQFVVDANYTHSCQEDDF